MEINDNSLLIQLLQSLKKQEIRLAGLYLQSPLFNQRDDVRQLFDALLLHIKKQKNVDKLLVFKEIYPEKPFDDLALRHLMAILLEHLRDFLAYRQWSSDTQQVSLDYAKAIAPRQLEDLHSRDMTRLRQAHQGQSLRHSLFYQQQYAWEHLEWTKGHQQQRLEGSGLPNMVQSLSVYIALETLRLRNAQLIQQRVTGTYGNADAQTLPYLKQSIELIESGFFEVVPSVMVYYYAYLTLQENALDEHFEKLVQLLDKQYIAFPALEQKDLYTIAINFCIQRINAGQRAFIREVFGIYKQGLAREILLDNGLISKYSYNNIMLTALALQEWEWAFDFLETYKKHLAPNERENTWKYNLAVYWFRRPDYDKMLETLRHVEFRDVLHNLDARRMLLRLYFERAEWLVLESHIESFKMYLRRHRNIGYHSELNQNLIKFTLKLMRLQQDPNPKDYSRLQEAIEKTNYVAERAWLLGQVKG